MSSASYAFILSLGLSVGACSGGNGKDTKTPAQGTMMTAESAGATAMVQDRLDPFTSGGSPPQLTVQASAARSSGSPTIEFNGMLQDPDMVSVAQFRLASETSTGSKPATVWMDLVLSGGKWEESTGRYNGQLMQHMTIKPGTYRIIVRAQDSKGSVTQAASEPISIP